MQSVARFLFIVVLCLFQYVHAQNAKLTNERLTLLGKIWGYTKYYHPTLSQGKIDWDSVLLHTIPLAKACQSDADFNVVIQGMLSAAGWQRVVKPKQKFEGKDWIEADKMLNEENKSELLFFKEKLESKENAFVGFDFQPFPNISLTEKEHLGLSSPDEKFRLLILFRYWNFVKYFYPHYTEIEKNWDELLIRLTPRMYFSGSDDDYQRVLLEMNRCLADNYTPYYLFDEAVLLGNYLLPFQVKIIDNQVIVASFLTEALAQNSPLKIGDEVISINDKSVKNVEKEQNRLASGSDATRKRQNLWNEHLSRQGLAESVIAVKRGQDTVTLTIKHLAYRDLYLHYQEKHTHTTTNQNPAWKVLKPEIGYVNAQYLSAQDLPQLAKSLEKTKTLLIDLRGYPMNISDELLSYFTHKEQTSFKIEYPDVKNMGKWLTAEIPNFERQVNENAPVYQGKIVVLIDEQTSGVAERMALAFKTIPNATLIGTASAGCPLTPSILKFPGDHWLGFHPTRIFTPDGKPISPKGITPDVLVTLTQQDVQQGRDVILEKALEWIASNP